MTTSPNPDIEMIDFEVRIPSLEGDEIGQVYTIKVPARKAADGEYRLTGNALELIERAHDRYMGLMTPQEIKKLRTNLKFTQKEMSELIQAGEKSYTRWENGKVRMSRLVNIILCAMRDGYLPMTYLQTLYKDGSDWYQKVQSHEAQLSQPIITPISAACIITTPVSAAVAALVVFKSDFLSYFRSFLKATTATLVCNPISV